jgi:putative SOS response-associated peptidase YedK
MWDIAGTLGTGRMCGRFTLRAPASVVAEQFGVFELETFTPRFNIAPTQPVAAVRMTAGDGPARRELVWLHWGLIPRWAQDPKIGARMINARSETAAEKPAFRAALRRRRCLVAADGFYEWQRTAGRKQPYFISMKDGRPFAFAGLWEHWEGPDDTVISSCTLLTTGPNKLVEPIHNRMPAILAAEDYDRWLDPAVEQPGPLMPLLRPYPDEEMTLYPVGTYVNSPAHDDPQCVARVAELF